MNYREELLKYMSLDELEKAINSKKEEWKGVISTEGVELLLAKELGIQIERSTEGDKEKQERDISRSSQENLFQRFSDFINLLDGNDTFLEKLSKIIGEIFAHNKCCHQAYNIPDIEDIYFNEFTSRIKAFYYIERICMNDKWYHQLDKPIAPEDTVAYKGSDDYYRHMLKHLNTSF